MAACARDLLTAEGIERIVGFLAASRTPEGVFHDRAGQSDLYYTVFGLGAFAALNGSCTVADAPVYACPAGGCRVEDLDFIDLVSLLRCRRYLPERTGDARAPFEREGALPAAQRSEGGGRRSENVVARRVGSEALIGALRAYRSRDGGYSHERRASETGTLYGAYLSEQAFRDAGMPWNAVSFVGTGLARLATPDGGFANHPGARHGVAAATASALVLRARYGGMESRFDADAATFLERLRDPDGGYRAAEGAHGSDLLSTACVRYAQTVCGMRVAPEALDADGTFIESLWSDAGGFRGHAADPLPDVEYTFYALLALGAAARASAGDPARRGPMPFVK